MLRIWRLGGILNDTEEVAVGIFQNDIIGVRRVSPGISPGTQSEQALDLHLLVLCVKVQVKPTSLEGPAARRAVEGEIGWSSVGIVQKGPALLRRVLRDVMESFLPEGQHLIELITPDDDGADSYHWGH